MCLSFTVRWRLEYSAQRYARPKRVAESGARVTHNGAAFTAQAAKPVEQSHDSRKLPG